MAVAVPRGNRQAILINATRADFGGDLKLAPRACPPGVTFEADTMAASQRRRPVLFTAEPDAPVAGDAGRRRRASPSIPKLEVPSEFSQTAELVLGQNNVPFWTRTVDSLAVAVTEEAPFSIEVVEPKVPAGPRRVDGAEGRAPRASPASRPRSPSPCPGTRPGVGSAGRDRDPREPGRGDDPAERRRRAPS